MQPNGIPSTQLIERTCEWCNRPFMTRKAFVKRGEGRFCSRTCAAFSVQRKRRGPLADRFWVKVDQSGGPEACWPFTGCRAPSGYGEFSVNNRSDWAHRVAYELTYGPIPSGMHVCHSCDHPPCCNPTHFFLGTQADNTADAKAKGRMQRGEDRASALLTEASVVEARTRYATGDVLVKDLAVDFGVHIVTMVSALHGKTWGHVTNPPPVPILERHGCSQLSWEDVRAIRAIHAEGKTSQAKIAAAFGTSQQAVSRIILNKLWRE